ncbi:hypothetical protein [Devosia sp. 2618]|uniref:hypothetical protein n=1 Tax=Devosia sp. 2618 TaxID=3156454 RepID=UPI00339A580F
MQYRYDHRNDPAVLKKQAKLIAADIERFTRIDVKKVADLEASGIHVFKLHYEMISTFSMLCEGMSGDAMCDGVNLEKAIAAAVSYARDEHAVDIHPLIISSDLIPDHENQTMSRNFILVSHCDFDGFLTRDAFVDFIERVANLNGVYEPIDCVGFYDALDYVGELGAHRY